MPIGISSGAITVRAAISAQSNKIAPSRAEAGMTRRLSPPTSIRATWGTISPTNPMMPEKATVTPVINAPTTKTVSRNRVTWICCVAKLNEFRNYDMLYHNLIFKFDV